MAHPLEAPLAPVLRDFGELRARATPLVLATIVATAGSTYRKCGTLMLIADDRSRGLLSGGCLESDLVLRARAIGESGRPQLASYDMRGEDDLLFGLGSGCEGAMDVLLQRVGPAEDWQPLARMAACAASRQREAIALVVDGPLAGRCWWSGGGTAGCEPPDAVCDAREASLASQQPQLFETAIGDETARVLILPVLPPPAMLILGAGADAQPLARLGVELGLAVTVSDHRPALCVPDRFPHCAVQCIAPADIATALSLSQFGVAVVMSHYLPADLGYLRALARTPSVGYVGLLGPAPRRERLLADLGPDAALLSGRLRAPLGLDIGARTPEAISVAAAAEIHAWFAGSSGRPWRDVLGSGGP